MNLTIQEVHTYNDLVKAGKAKELKLSGVDSDTVVIPQLDEKGVVYFLDLSSRVRVYPGVNMIEKIKNTIDSQEKP